MTNKTKPTLLSNKELLEEIGQINNPTWSPEEAKRKKELLGEIYRRLEEPWRRLKNGK